MYIVKLQGCALIISGMLIPGFPHVLYNCMPVPLVPVLTVCEVLASLLCWLAHSDYIFCDHFTFQILQTDLPVIQD